MLNLPSGSVKTPWEPLLTLTLTLARGAWEDESSTIPVIVLVCPKPASDKSPAIRIKMICRILEIGLLFLKNKADFKFGNIGK